MIIGITVPCYVPFPPISWHNGWGSRRLDAGCLCRTAHDIGNAKIDPIVLNKPSKLTEEENEEVRQHTTYGYQILKNVAAVNEGVRLATLQHHEKVDGSGYPLRLEGTRFISTPRSLLLRISFMR